MALAYIVRFAAPPTRPEESEPAAWPSISPRIAASSATPSPSSMTLAEEAGEKSGQLARHSDQNMSCKEFKRSVHAGQQTTSDAQSAEQLEQIRQIPTSCRQHQHCETVGLSSWLAYSCTGVPRHREHPSSSLPLASPSRSGRKVLRERIPWRA